MTWPTGASSAKENILTWNLLEREGNSTPSLGVSGWKTVWSGSSGFGQLRQNKNKYIGHKTTHTIHTPLAQRSQRHLKEEGLPEVRHHRVVPIRVELSVRPIWGRGPRKITWKRQNDWLDPTPPKKHPTTPYLEQASFEPWSLPLRPQPLVQWIAAWWNKPKF